MLLRSAYPLTLSVAPSWDKGVVFRWIIRTADGVVLRQSPCAFATREGAQLAGRCALSAMAAEQAG